MASKIEETIEDLEIYIDSCKPSAFSSSKIVVNRDEIEVLISELKTKIPEEVSRYQKIINNQESILARARDQAKEIIEAAKVHTNELVSEHIIMQEAYNKANEVVGKATKQAQDALDSATKDANEIRRGAIAYTDELLEKVQEIIVKSIDLTRNNQDNYLNKMQGFLDTVVANRMSLSPDPIVEEIINNEPLNKQPKQTVPAKSATPANTPNPQQNMQKQPVQQPVQAAQAQGGVASTMEKTMVEIPINEPPAGSNSTANTGVIDIPEEFFKKD